MIKRRVAKVAAIIIELVAARLQLVAISVAGKATRRILLVTIHVIGEVVADVVGIAPIPRIHTIGAESLPVELMTAIARIAGNTSAHRDSRSTARANGVGCRHRWRRRRGIPPAALGIHPATVMIQNLAGFQTGARHIKVQHRGGQVVGIERIG